jgi:hypothetical protein
MRIGVSFSVTFAKGAAATSKTATRRRSASGARRSVLLAAEGVGTELAPRSPSASSLWTFRSAAGRDHPRHERGDGRGGRHRRRFRSSASGGPMGCDPIAFVSSSFPRFPNSSASCSTWAALCRSAGAQSSSASTSIISSLMMAAPLDSARHGPRLTRRLRRAGYVCLERCGKLGFAGVISGRCLH